MTQMIRKLAVRANRAGLAAAVALLVGVGACSPVAATDAATGAPATTAASTANATKLHPISGLAVIPLKVVTAKGEHAFQVEVAATPLAQERGLMWRTAMGADEGMIFPNDPPRRTAFWMRNTVIGLDIIYVGADHRVLNIAANAVP